MRRGVVFTLALAACDQAFDLVEVAPIPPDAAVESGLVALYSMDSIDNADLIDSVGARHGVCNPVTCPQPAAGVRDGALHFDGTSTVIDVPGDDAFETTSAFTISVWMKLDVGAGAACFANKLYGNTRNSWQFCTFADVQYLYTTNGTDDARIGPVGITEDAWHHLAARYDGTVASLWFDGTWAAEAVTTVSFDGSGLVFGADRDSGAPSVHLAGSLDELRIYSRALADAEIAELARP